MVAIPIIKIRSSPAFPSIPLHKGKGFFRLNTGRFDTEHLQIEKRYATDQLQQYFMHQFEKGMRLHGIKMRQAIMHK